MSSIPFISTFQSNPDDDDDDDVDTFIFNGTTLIYLFFY